MARRIVVVILTYNSAAFIRPCLEALRKDGAGLARHVVVVDNASADGTMEIVRREFPEVEALAMDANLGVSKGNNAVLAQYDADHYVLLNPDTEVTPGWLDALVAEATSDPHIGIVGGKLLYPDGRIQHVGGESAPTGPRHFGQLEDASRYMEPADVDFVTFACALVTREVLARVGYLDEAYTPYYYEDADLCLRARAASFRVRYTPRCVVVHHENASTGKGAQPSVAKARILERNRLRYKLIHDPPTWWLRSAWQEAKTLAGHTARGRGRAILGAWADAARNGAAIRARRKARAGFVPSMWSPPDRHAPTRSLPP